MPVPAPVALDATTSQLPGPTAAAPAPGFAAALAAVTAGSVAPQLPTVTLGVMVQALASPTLPAVAPPPVPAAANPVVEAATGNAVERSTPVSAPSVPSGGAKTPVIRAAERYLGVPYRWGGTDPSRGFDCSGFVQRAFADVGVRLPRVSVDQARAGTAVAGLGQARPGDLVFWKASGGRPNHIGIYAGEGRMIVAPRTGDVVKYQQITRTPDAIRRVV